MNATTVGPSLYNGFKKRLYAAARHLRGPSHPTPLTVAVARHETIGRRNRGLPVTLHLHNPGPGHSFDPACWMVSWRPERDPSRVVYEAGVPLNVPVLRGQTESVPVEAPCPPFLGRFVLGHALKGSAPHLLRTPIEVMAKSEEDIDYVAVYRNTDLTANDWHVVGPSTEAEHKRQAGLKLEQLLAAGLTPDSAVFDVGCGTGQLALALEPFLSDRGFYFGCDIGAEGIEHCRRRFRRPNFRFDVSGMTTLPTIGRTFDFITLFSVFTHTLADETMLLLHEMKRYLSPKGCVYADFFFSEFVDRYAGNRGRIEYERAYWERMLALVGYRSETANAWQVEPHTRRDVFKLFPM
jgi:ubiquinone/menaquinone biosynthesis C-methylase UbiE